MNFVLTHENNGKRLINERMHSSPKLNSHLGCWCFENALLYGFQHFPQLTPKWQFSYKKGRKKDIFKKGIHKQEGTNAAPLMLAPPPNKNVLLDKVIIPLLSSQTHQVVRPHFSSSSVAMGITSLYTADPLVMNMSTPLSVASGEG